MEKIKEMPVPASFPCGAAARRGSLLAMLVLAGCSGFGAAEDSGVPPCPRTGFLEDAGQITRFDGTGRDAEDVAVTARFAGLGGDCAYTDEGPLRVTMSVVMEATRGPAAETREIALPYFVAVLRHEDGAVLNKEVFDVSLTFPEERRRVSLRDGEFAIEIPLAEGQTGEDFEILVGFQLTPAELDYNRSGRLLP